MLDLSSYSHPGGQNLNHDRLLYVLDENGQTCDVVLCDGLNGSSAGGLAAEFCVQSCLEKLRAGLSPEQAALETQTAFMHKRLTSLQLKKAGSTLCAFHLDAGRVSWANIGDSRLYHFSRGELAHVSVDDSVAFPDYLNGKISYEELRLHPLRAKLSACIGDERLAQAHVETFALAEGDAFLICSDGFWQYIYEMEICLELAKAASAADWLRQMLLRIVQRSFLDGDNLTAFALIYNTIPEEV